MDTGSDTIKITLPASWEELTQRQLYAVLSMLARGYSLTYVQAWAVFHLAGIRVIRRMQSSCLVSVNDRIAEIPSEHIAVAARSLAWMENTPEVPVRLARIQRRKAADELLRGFRFGDYLALENFYQGYLATQEQGMIDEMARLLYSSSRLRLNDTERYAVLFWVKALKDYLARQFSDFFQPVSGGDMMGGADPRSQAMDAMNAQIRALTKGDVTKERQVLEMDCWRAFTELNAIARESEEIRKKMKK